LPPKEVLHRGFLIAPWKESKEGDQATIALVLVLSRQVLQLKAVCELVKDTATGKPKITGVTISERFIPIDRTLTGRIEITAKVTADGHEVDLSTATLDLERREENLLHLEGNAETLRTVAGVMATVSSVL
jgi:hypothetical protein